jgi:hypothetical protein
MSFWIGREKTEQSLIQFGIRIKKYLRGGLSRVNTKVMRDAPRPRPSSNHSISYRKQRISDWSHGISDKNRSVSNVHQNDSVSL